MNNKNQTQHQAMILAELAGEADGFYDRPLTLGRLAEGETGSLTVTLTLSEAGVAQVSAAALDYSTVMTYYDNGVLTIQGDAAEVRAMLDSLVIQVPLGHVEPIAVDVVVGVGDALNEVRLMLMYDQEDDRYIVMTTPNSEGESQREALLEIEGLVSSHAVLEESWEEWQPNTVGVNTASRVEVDNETDVMGPSLGPADDGRETENINAVGSRPNRAPIADDDGLYAVTEDAVSANLWSTVLGNDSDPDGDVLVVDSATAPAGTFTIDSGAEVFTYTASGWDSLAQGATTSTTVTYTISDGKGGTDTASFDFTITGVNDAPTMGADAVSVAENTTSANIHATVMLNDVDVDTADTFDITAVDTTGTTGTVVFNAGTDTLTYEATAAFDSLAVGETTTDTFDYTVTDGFGGMSTTTVTVTITGVNDGPTAVDDSGLNVEQTATTTNLHATLISNDTDPDTSDVLDIQSVDTSGTTGSVTFNGATNSLTYTASGFALAPGASTTDTFDYTVSDGNGGTDTATVTMTINNTILNFTASAVDSLLGNSLTNLITGDGADWHSTDTVDGAAGNDTVRITSGTANVDFNTYSNVSSIEAIELNSDAAHDLTLTDTFVDGTESDNVTITTTATTQGIDVDASALAAGRTVDVTGGGAADTLSGGAGDDTIDGGAGGDSITAGTGTDSIDAGANNDLVYGAGSSFTDADFIDGGTGTDTLRATAMHWISTSRWPATTSALRTLS
jgi:hypothetical protein